MASAAEAGASPLKPGDSGLVTGEAIASKSAEPMSTEAAAVVNDPLPVAGMNASLPVAATMERVALFSLVMMLLLVVNAVSGLWIVFSHRQWWHYQGLFRGDHGLRRV